MRGNLMSRTPPNSIIKDLYLEITNIAQGVNIAIFVYIIATRDFVSLTVNNYFSTPFIAIASLLIVVIFWARYYLDTVILNRSFTILSLIWFFLYVVVQGVSISFITDPVAWFMSTSVFLFFGAGFYWLNLREIERKQAAGILPACPEFVRWQAKRLIDLAVFSLLSFSGAILISLYPSLVLPAAIFTLTLALVQVRVTHDYRRLSFIETGI